ncbi:MAG: glycosyltransferase family 2 protein [Pseudomonadota bacterium]
MDLSIVIVNWNTREMTRECLSSVCAGLGALRAEIWLVDNASEDGSAEMVRESFPDVRLIENTENRGFAAANNQALEQCSGRHVLLLNSDTLVHGDVLTASVSYLDRHPHVGVMGCRVLNADGSLQITGSRFPSLLNLALQASGATRLPGAFFDRYQMTRWDRKTERALDVISGCFMMVRGTAMREVGLLDEAFFFYGEETDWCRRFAKAGWTLMLAPVGEITHFGGGSVKKLNHKRDVMLSEGTVRLHRKHFGWLGGAACWLLLLGFNGSRAVVWSAISVTGTKARARARHFRSVVANFGQVWPRGVR